MIRPPFVVKELNFQQVTGFHIAWRSATELTGGDARRATRCRPRKAGRAAANSSRTVR